MSQREKYDELFEKIVDRYEECDCYSIVERMMKINHWVHEPKNITKRYHPTRCLGDALATLLDINTDDDSPVDYSSIYYLTGSVAGQEEKLESMINGIEPVPNYKEIFELYDTAYSIMPLNHKAAYCTEVKNMIKLTKNGKIKTKLENHLKFFRKNYLCIEGKRE